MTVTNDPVAGQPLLLRAQGEGQAFYIYNGAPGSPMSILGADADQEVEFDYDPFGVRLTEDGASEPQNPYSFGATGVKDRATGVKDRATGWVRYGFRYYDPKTGTFTQQDTIDAPLDPANGNRYAYAGNDPISNIDPTGLSARCALLGIGGRYLEANSSLNVSGPCLAGGASVVLGTIAFLAAPFAGAIPAGLAYAAYPLTVYGTTASC